MLTELYRSLARMGAAREDGTVDEITEDMIGTFEEAREEALARGSLHYLRFGGREIMGQFARLMGTPERLLPSGLVTWTVLGGLAGALVYGSVWLWSPVTFRSEAMVRIMAAQVPDELLESTISNQLAERVPTMFATVLSRSRLSQIIRTKELYPNLTSEAMIYDVTDTMRDHAELLFDGVDRIDVSFEYTSGNENGLTWLFDETTDDMKAQEVVQELVAQLMSENVENRGRATYQTQEFFAHRLELAWSRWEKLNAELAELSPSDPRYPRVELDRDLARQHYIETQERNYVAEELNELQERAQGERFEVIDQATLPAVPVRLFWPSVREGAVNGFVVGLGVWILLFLRKLVQRSTSPMTADAN